MGFGGDLAIGIISALLGGYFLASFLVIGWGITKYVELSDRLKETESRLDRLQPLEQALKIQGEQLLTQERPLESYTGGGSHAEPK